jgi:hypothetical protein
VFVILDLCARSLRASFLDDGVEFENLPINLRIKVLGGTFAGGLARALLV